MSHYNVQIHTQHIFNLARIAGVLTSKKFNVVIDYKRIYN